MDSEQGYDRYFDLGDEEYYLEVATYKDVIWITLSNEGFQSIKEWKIDKVSNDVREQLKAVEKHLQIIEKYIKDFLNKAS